MEPRTAEYCPDNTQLLTHFLDLRMAFSTCTITALLLTLQGDHYKHTLSQVISNTDVIHGVMLCIDWEHVVNLLVCLLTGLEASLVLTQEKTLSVNRGDNLKIACTESGSSGNYVLSWYQQKSGSPPKYLLYTTGSRASGVPSRFYYSGTRNDKTEYLLINGVAEEDEATYFCACHNCGSDHSATVQLGACTKTYQRRLGWPKREGSVTITDFCHIKSLWSRWKPRVRIWTVWDVIYLI